jgi:hypothetical protein
VGEFVARYGPWAVVTGAAQGVGLAFTEALIARGLGVVMVDVGPRVTDVAAALGDERSARPLVADLANPLWIDALEEATDQLEVGPGGRQRRRGFRRTVSRHGSGAAPGDSRGQLHRHRRPGIVGAAGDGRARPGRVCGHQLRVRTRRHGWGGAVQRHQGLLGQPDRGPRLGVGRLRRRHPRRGRAHDGHPDVPLRRGPTRRAPSPHRSTLGSSSRERSTHSPQAAVGWPMRGWRSPPASTVPSGWP